jgi:uroporphyrinogen III methyltransferase / synthase
MLDSALSAIRPGALTVVVMMGVAGRDEIAARLAAHGWPPETPTAIVCGASTRDEWTWTGRLAEVAAARPPAGVPGLLVVGEVVRVREALAAARGLGAHAGDEVKYGRS